MQVIDAVIAMLIPFAAIVVIVLVLRLQRRARRQMLCAQPLPPQWREILEHNVPIFRRLPERFRKELESDMNVFLAEKRFEGCGGLEMTDEIRVTIAAQACILLVNHPVRYYPKLSAVLVYPTAYVAEGKTTMGTGGLVVEGPSARAGESWQGGDLVLAWDHVKRAACDVRDGHNVVLHEFAHQLDQEDGASDGAPILESRSGYATWAHVFAGEYEKLCRDVAKHHKTVIDPYGATNPAEFFAVVTEAFFEKPRALRRKEPELYDQLKGYYHLDPATWQDVNENAYVSDQPTRKPKKHRARRHANN